MYINNNITINAYMYIYIYIYMYVYVYIYIYIYIHTYIHTYIHRRLRHTSHTWGLDLAPLGGTRGRSNIILRILNKIIHALSYYITVYDYSMAGMPECVYTQPPPKRQWCNINSSSQRGGGATSLQTSLCYCSVIGLIDL